MFFLIERIFHPENYKENINTCTQLQTNSLRIMVENSTRKLETLLYKQKEREKVKGVFVAENDICIH